MADAVHHSAALAHQFDNLEQQKEASTLGMWVFLVTEVLFFGGLFTVYTVYRSLYPKPAEQFYSLYFAMTGLHALHMIIGVGIMSVILVMAKKEIFDGEYYTPVEVAGLYWHFVDIVWIFLFPLLYLIGRHYHAG